MYLKRIEAMGFKSFADKTIIEFQEGITAVVGPNGSGKSNISDAIKWVLGEQSSKSLRGDKMADVIFSGTTERAPLNVAEVSIVFDNSDRTLPVDYEEVAITRRLFRSGDSQYLINKQKVRLKDVRDLVLDSGVGADSLSIISQDKVRAVIEAKNDDRRAVIEEAAGVLKYKNRKKETVRNLEHTETNLERAYDILHELEIQYNHLEKQAVVAKEFLEVKQQLEGIEIALYARDIEIALKSIREIDQSMQNQSLQVVDYEAMQIKNKDQIETFNRLKVELETEIRKYQEQLMEINSKISYIEGQRKALSGQSTAQDFELIFKENLEHIESKQEELKHINERIQISQQRLSDKRKQLTGERNQYYIKNSNHQSLRSKIELLNDFSNSYYGGVRNVLNAASHGQLRGIHGTVDSLIHTDEQYITAIEVTLQAATQHIVIDRVQDANQAIAYLKRGNLGRATFLPIEAMKPRVVDQRTLQFLQGQMGYLDLAVHLVHYDHQFESIMQNLLGNVIICDNLENATRIAKAINNSYRIITLEGDVIHVGGSMTGGRQEKRTPSLLQQRQKLDEATQELAELERELPRLEREVAILEGELHQIEQGLQRDHIEQSRLNEYLRAKQDVFEQLKASMEADDVKVLIEQKNHIAELLRDLRSKNIENTEAIQHLERENNEIIKFIRSATTEIHNLDIEKNRIDVRYNNALDFLINEYHMTFDHAKANFKLEMDYEVAKIRVRNLRRHIEGLGNVNINAIDEFEDVKNRYESLKDNVDDLVKAKENILASIKELDEVMIERFKTTFERVNTEFNLVFRQLFKGGHAELILEDETDLLNTGIDIIAQPPGTKLNNANLLSGGQKTLTSISLLFAILRVKVMPFVILDECEAALDDANVVRYADYIQRFSENSQFIVITHRKGTMEKADTLYGVTMQESGVTTIVSVRFEDTDEYIEQDVSA
jgi:chromosome segregation protein